MRVQRPFCSKHIYASLRLLSLPTLVLLQSLHRSARFWLVRVFDADLIPSKMSWRYHALQLLRLYHKTGDQALDPGPLTDSYSSVAATCINGPVLDADTEARHKGKRSDKRPIQVGKKPLLPFQGNATYPPARTDVWSLVIAGNLIRVCMTTRAVSI
jgi:hypothetical protein